MTDRVDHAVRRARRWALAAGVLVLAAACTVAPAPEVPAAPGGAGLGEGGAVIRRVVDGDTIVARIGTSSADETIRLIGIDTPETKKPNTDVECFGQQASDRLHELLPEGTTVRLERDAEARDRYDRLLAYVYLPDGTFVNLAMVNDGFAAPLTIPPNVAYTEQFTAAGRTARTEGRGLWSSCGGAHERER